MEMLSNAVFSACAGAAALTLIDLLAPGKKFQKQLRLIFSLVFLLTVFAPLFKGEEKLPEISLSDPESTVSIQTDQFLLEQTRINTENALKERLLAEGFYAEEISAVIHTSPDGCISISEVEITCQPGTDLTAVERLAEKETGAAVTVTESEKGQEDG